MSDQKNVVTYELDVQSGAAQMAIAQTLQSAKGGISAGLTEPIRSFLEAGQSNVAQQHTLSSQRMAAGWANLQTAASEYTQKGFYQNLVFGSRPEFSGGASSLHTARGRLSLPVSAKTAGYERCALFKRTHRRGRGTRGFRRPDS